MQAVAAELNVDVEIEGDELEGDALEGDEVEGLEAEEAPIEDELALEGEDDMLRAVETMLAEAGVEVVDDERVTEDLVKKVAGRVAQRLLKEFS